MQRAALVVAMLGLAVPVFGGQSAPAPSAPPRLGSQRPKPSTDRQRQLFQVQDLLKAALQQAEASVAMPRVVCGMLVVPADPTIDPRMRVTPPQDPSVDYKIRAFEPPICRP